MGPFVVLIGFMGSGKTTVGTELARILQWNFVDNDVLVEETLGISIPEAFEKLGEQGFRLAEQKAIARVLSKANISPGGTVLSLGGGAITIPEVAEKLAAMPFVFFLDEDPETAFNRVKDGSRPLAGDKEQFTELYRTRKEIYLSLANHVVDVRKKSVVEVASEVAGIIRERMGSL